MTSTPTRASGAVGARRDVTSSKVREADRAREATMPGSAPHAERWAATLTKAFLRAEAKAGRTPKETAAAVGCSENTVRDELARHGLLDIDGAPKSLVRDYVKHGSITAVADIHGVSFSTARRWLLAAGVELNGAHRPPSAELDVERAAGRYETGESLAAIAADAGIGVNTLKRRLEAHGTVMRPRGRPANSG